VPSQLVCTVAYWCHALHTGRPALGSGGAGVSGPWCHGVVTADVSGAGSLKPYVPGLHVNVHSVVVLDGYLMVNRRLCSCIASWGAGT
jgi:hypothetical protein